MLEALLNGRLGAWWEVGIVVAITIPFWFLILQFLVYVVLKVSSFIVDVLLFWRLN